MARFGRSQLNYDILLQVMAEVASVSVPDCMRMMRSCKSLYAGGVKIVLSHKITLSEEESFLSFLASLRLQDGNRPRRHSHVRALELDVCDLSEDALRQLIDALPLFVGLRYLDLPWGDYLLESHPGLTDAFAALTSLRELRITGIGLLSMRLLQTLRSQLVVIDLNIDRGAGSGAHFDSTALADWREYHPTLALARFSPTLQKLSASGWYTLPELTLEPTILFPNMRSLDLQFARLPRTMAYICAFPNLSYLSYKAIELDGLPPNPGHRALAGCRRHHRLNLDDQLSSGRTWEKLQRFSGSVLDLYALGLACLIEHLELYGIEDDWIDMLEAVLSYARPQCLELLGWPGTIRGSRTCVLTRANSARLQDLSVRGHLGKYDDEVDVASVLESLRASLEGSPLELLRVELSSTALDPRPRKDSEETLSKTRGAPSPPSISPPRSEDYTSSPAERSLQDFDLEDYLRRFAETVPTLQRATMVFNGPRNERRGRMVEAKDGHPLRITETLG